MNDKLVRRGYQWEAIRFLLARKGAALFADPGLGKTIIVLTVVSILKKINPGLKTLVIAPLPVALNTWPEEVQDWPEFSHLRISVLHGRNRVGNLKRDADVYVLNSENIFWLFDTILSDFDHWPFNFLVVDESTLFKNWSSKRTKVLRKFHKLFDRTVTLTGTPTPKSLLDIFAQMYLADGGESLGPYLSKWREKYFYKTGFRNKEWAPHADTEEKIITLISGNTMRIERKDAVELPEFHEVIVPVVLPPKVMKIYEEFEGALFSELDGDELFVPSASQNYGICRQIAAGGLYEPQGLFVDTEGERTIYDTHSAKLEALTQLHGELHEKPIFLAYLFDFNRTQLSNHKPMSGKIKIPSGAKKQEQISAIKKQFLAGKVPVFAVHPQSVSHGLNLQKGPCRSICWYSPTNNLEQYLQFNMRIHRPGVGSAVTAYILIAKGTIEEVVYGDLRSKDNSQEGFLDGLRKYRRAKIKKAKQKGRSR